MEKEDRSRERLSKIMAHRGMCSRREADDLIVRGLVSVNGITISTLGTKILPDAEILISQYARAQIDNKLTVIVNKPVGYVSSQPEDGYKSAYVLLKDQNRQPHSRPYWWRRQDFQGLAPVGRLDIDSRGLLIYTQDGRLAKKVIGPNSNVEKEYLVYLDRDLSSQEIIKLSDRFVLDGVELKSAKIAKSIGRSTYHHMGREIHSYRVILTEGKKRQIRRMCQAIDARVISLKRIRIGRLHLGRLQEGCWRLLQPGEEI